MRKTLYAASVTSYREILKSFQNAEMGQTWPETLNKRTFEAQLGTRWLFARKKGGVRLQTNLENAVSS